jgi:hypothetical protein
MALKVGGVGIRNQFFEYSDLRRNPGPEDRKHITDLLSLHYGRPKIDVIITLGVDGMGAQPLPPRAVLPTD